MVSWFCGCAGICLLKLKEPPIVASVNRWNVLEPESASSSSISCVKTKDPGKQGGNHHQSVPGLEPSSSHSSSAEAEGDLSKADASSKVVDDWEKAYE